MNNSFPVYSHGERITCQIENLCPNGGSECSAFKSMQICAHTSTHTIKGLAFAIKFLKDILSLYYLIRRGFAIRTNDPSSTSKEILQKRAR